MINICVEINNMSNFNKRGKQGIHRNHFREKLTEGRIIKYLMKEKTNNLPSTYDKFEFFE